MRQARNDKFSKQVTVHGAAIVASLIGTLALGAEDATHEIPTIAVLGERVANEEPASAYASIVTSLRYDPEIDVQSRGLAESQSDITVRGGVFENTAASLGAVTIFDPQTGHYTALMPIDPGALSAPSVVCVAFDCLQNDLVTSQVVSRGLIISVNNR